MEEAGSNVKEAFGNVAAVPQCAQCLTEMALQRVDPIWFKTRKRRLYRCSQCGLQETHETTTGVKAALKWTASVK